MQTLKNALTFHEKWFCGAININKRVIITMTSFT